MCINKIYKPIQNKIQNLNLQGKKKIIKKRYKKNSIHQNRIISKNCIQQSHKKMLSQESNDDNSSILSLMKQSKIYWQVKRQVINQLGKTWKSSSWQPSVQEIIKGLLSTDNESKINGLILNCLQKSTKRLPIQQDPIGEIELYRQKWSQLTSREFASIANRIVRNQQYDQEDQSVNYCYDSSSMLQFLSSIKAKNPSLLRDSPVLLFQNQIIKVSNYQQIRNKFSFLMSSDNIIGGNKDQDLKQREKKANKIVDGENIASQIQNFLLYGSISTSRVNVYKRYFECFYQYTGKKVEFSLYEKVWKPIIRMDCKQILKDPQYFVFKQELEKVYKQFICDKQVSQMIKRRQLTPSVQLDKYSPIHHILPCKGFSTYIAPFCYTSTSSDQIYELWREVYCNYLAGLHTISSSSTEGILGLCILFEELLFTSEKRILQKFESLNIQPLRIVFPWIFYCMIGYIEVQQFFLMMDRIIATKSLEIVVVYCVALLFKAKSQILEAKNQMQIIECLLDQMTEDFWIQTVRDYFKYHL